MLRVRLATILACLTFIVGCAKNGAYTNTAYQPAGTELAGYLVGSFAAVTSGAGAVHMESSQLVFREIGQGKPAGAIGMAARKNLLSLKPSTEADIQEGSRKILFYSIPLKPGRYEFYDVKYFRNSTAGGTTYSAKESFSIPFTIKPGVAHYVGEMRVERVTGKNLFGFRVLAGATMARYDKQQRDEPQLRTRFPQIASQPVEKLKLNTLAPPLVVDGLRFDEARRGNLEQQLEQLQTATGNELRKIGNQLIRENNYQPELLNAAATRIANGYMSSDELTADGLAYLARLIGNSGEIRYLPIIRRASENSPFRGLRRHSSKAVEQLEASSKRY